MSIDRLRAHWGLLTDIQDGDGGVTLDGDVGSERPNDQRGSGGSRTAGLEPVLGPSDAGGC